MGWRRSRRGEVPGRRLRRARAAGALGDGRGSGRARLAGSVFGDDVFSRRVSGDRWISPLKQFAAVGVWSAISPSTASCGGAAGRVGPRRAPQSADPLLGDAPARSAGLLAARRHPQRGRSTENRRNRARNSAFLHSDLLCTCQESFTHAAQGLALQVAKPAPRGQKSHHSAISHGTKVAAAQTSVKGVRASPDIFRLARDGA